MPKDLTPAQLVDQYQRLRQQRQALAMKDSELVKQQKTIELEVLRYLLDTKAEGLRGKLASVSRKTMCVPELVSYDDLAAWIRKGKGSERFPVFHRRLSVTVVQEFWQQGKSIGGLETKEFDKLTFTKR